MKTVCSKGTPKLLVGMQGRECNKCSGLVIDPLFPQKSPTSYNGYTDYSR